MSGAIVAPSWRRLDGKTVEVTLTMEPMESVLLVFQSAKRPLPPRWDHEAAPVHAPVLVVRDSSAPYGQGPWGTIVFGARSPMLSPLKPDPFLGRCTVPGDVDINACRVYLEMDDLPPPEMAAAVTVNGRPAGGVIGRPFRVDVTRLLRPGENTVEIVPVSPKNARLVFY